MPFRSTFDCLWCGRPHQVRTERDLEGFAQLCPDCVGKAQDNGFLRFRLRAALAERAAVERGASEGTSPVVVASAPPRSVDEEMLAYYAARAPEYDDWYLRRGRYSHGPISDMAWQMDLDQATTWLDRQPLAGEIVELAAGTGFWSPLLAQKGELSLYDAVEAPLDRARERLMAHGLRAHLHVRDAWEEPDRQVDALFTGFWLSHVPRDRLPDFLGVCRRWLKVGGRFALIDSRPDPDSGVVDRLPPPGPELSRRRLADGREYTIPKVFYAPDELVRALRDAGFADAEVTTTNRFFVLGTATA
jgi:SAM-dependent methyltransferase